MLRIIFLSIIFTPLVMFAQVTNSTTAFQIMNAQQTYILQQQQIQLAAMQNQTQTGISPQVQGMIQLAAHFCPLLLTGESGNSAMGKSGRQKRKTASDIEKITEKAREDSGAIKEKEVNEDLAKAIGADVAAKLSAECGMFMNKEGKMGPAGSYLLQQIRDKKDVFAKSVRGESYAKKFCPNYASLNQGEKELFWLWTMVAKSSNDVKCVQQMPEASNKSEKPVKTEKSAGKEKPVVAPAAIAQRAPGMFAINPLECPKMSDAKSLSQSLQCGLDLMAGEVRTYNGDASSTKFLKDEDRKLAAQFRLCDPVK